MFVKTKLLGGFVGCFLERKRPFVDPEMFEKTVESTAHRAIFAHTHTIR